MQFSTCMRDRVASHASILRFVLGALSTLPACAQSPPQQRYMISVGTSSEKVSSGTIWLYSYSWYGLQKIELAAIKKGLALVPLDTRKLKHELDPNPTTDGYVVVLQIGEHLWYRTPDISPNLLWNDLIFSCQFARPSDYVLDRRDSTDFASPRQTPRYSSLSGRTRSS